MSSRNWHVYSGLKSSESAAKVLRRQGAPLPFQLLAAALILVIRGYQLMVSPLLGPMCRFRPTCSTYAVQSIRRYGPLSGSVRAVARLARCHPLGAGGYDPVR